MRLSDFDFELPQELIAQAPLRERSASRLLRVCQSGSDFEDLGFINLLDYLNPNDLLVFNDTRVIKARMSGVKATGGRVEIMADQVLSNRSCKALLRSNHSVKIGQVIRVGDAVDFEVVAIEDGIFELLSSEDLDLCFEKFGEVPLPPYIKRSVVNEDEDRYQTIYAKDAGAVAAPTAGLHFDEKFLELIKAKGVSLAFVTLHVGAGTFKPVKVENVKEHRMHFERYVVPSKTIEAIADTKQRGGRICAVGTTSLRALESAFDKSTSDPEKLTGDTNLFILPGYQFKVVDCLLTNFHLPKSTLMMLVSAFIGRERIMAAYKHAIEKRYRFFSYGDAMFLER
ncbi:MAG: tRNA preQ1(34) S-adenosylmethionine ribosyltransferase-isomerase QueA [Betaproteobacteria bacterium]